MSGTNGPLAQLGTLSWKRTLGRMYGPPRFTLGKSCNVSFRCGPRKMFLEGPRPERLTLINAHYTLTPTPAQVFDLAKRPAT